MVGVTNAPEKQQVHGVAAEAAQEEVEVVVEVVVMVLRQREKTSGKKKDNKRNSLETWHHEGGLRLEARVVDQRKD